MLGMVSMLPDMMVVAVGMALAFKLRGEQRCALTWFGDGSTSRGDFHEAMNWAGVQRLPVVFVLENNQYAYSTPLDKQFAVDPVQRAAAYGFSGVTVDGNAAALTQVTAHPDTPVNGQPVTAIVFTEKDQGGDPQTEDALMGNFGDARVVRVTPDGTPIGGDLRHAAGDEQ